MVMANENFAGNIFENATTNESERYYNWQIILIVVKIDKVLVGNLTKITKIVHFKQDFDILRRAMRKLIISRQEIC